MTPKSKALGIGKGGEMSAKDANDKAISWQKKTGRDYHTGKKLPKGHKEVFGY